MLELSIAPNSRLEEKIRRDSGITSGFITPAGTVSSDCTKSSVCYINGQGQLSLASGGIYATNASVASELFAPSVGTISTTWQLSGAVAKWNNAAFNNGAAALCLDPNAGTVSAYFTISPPASCIPVVLTSVAGAESLLVLRRDLLIECSIIVSRPRALCD